VPSPEFKPQCHKKIRIPRILKETIKYPHVLYEDIVTIGACIITTNVTTSWSSQDKIK
jgi:hypothetical protein